MLNAAEIHNSTCYFQVEFKKLNVTGMKEAVTSIVVWQKYGGFACVYIMEAHEDVAIRYLD